MSAVKRALRAQSVDEVDGATRRDRKDAFVVQGIREPAHYTFDVGTSALSLGDDVVFSERLKLQELSWKS